MKERLRKMIEKGLISDYYVADLISLAEKHPNLNVIVAVMGKWETVRDCGSYVMDYNPHTRDKEPRETGICLLAREVPCFGMPYEVGYNGALHMDEYNVEQIITKS